MTELFKKHSSIGCCGIDCGLCPRFYTKGDSICPGCGGVNFKDKHPSCGFLSCCNIKNGFEICAECTDFPCIRFNPEKKGFDSFVTHQRVFPNLDFIKSNGLDEFIQMQTLRMNILKEFLDSYDDGHSKSFFCISCTLLPLKKIEKAQKYIQSADDSFDLKAKNKMLKKYLLTIAKNMNIELKLNHG